MSRKGIITLVGIFVLLFIGSAYAQVPMASFISDRSGDDEIYLLYDNGEVKQLTKNKSRCLPLRGRPMAITLFLIAMCAGLRTSICFLLISRTR